LSNYIDQGALAEKAFAEYEFGDGVMVTDTSGWEYTTPGHMRTRKVYVETEREDDGPAPRWVLNFTVRFDPVSGALSEAYAMDEKGQIWGNMASQREVSNYIESSSMTNDLGSSAHRYALASHDPDGVVRWSVGGAWCASLLDHSPTLMTGPEVDAFKVRHPNARIVDVIVYREACEVYSAGCNSVLDHSERSTPQTRQAAREAGIKALIRAGFPEDALNIVGPEHTEQAPAAMKLSNYIEQAAPKEVEAVVQTFLDYTEAGFGLLVKRSAHFKEQSCIPANQPDELGIVVGKTFHEENGQVICYPEVHWEGKASSSTNHPMNVTPYREHNLKEIVFTPVQAHTAYEATAEDVENVLRSNSLAVANTNGKSFEAMAEELHGDLDFDLIEKAALAGDDLDEQTGYANDEIARQLREMGVLEPLKQAYDSPSPGM